jgi:hypothetical protein
MILILGTMFSKNLRKENSDSVLSTPGGEESPYESHRHFYLWNRDGCFVYLGSVAHHAGYPPHLIT